MAIENIQADEIMSDIRKLLSRYKSKKPTLSDNKVFVNEDKLKKIFPYYCDDCKQQHTCDVPIAREENIYNLVNKTIPTDRNACHAHLLACLQREDSDDVS